MYSNDRGKPILTLRSSWMANGSDTFDFFALFLSGVVQQSKGQVAKTSRSQSASSIQPPVARWISSHRDANTSYVPAARVRLPNQHSAPRYITLWHWSYTDGWQMKGSVSVRCHPTSSLQNSFRAACHGFFRPVGLYWRMFNNTLTCADGPCWCTDSGWL